MWEILSIIADLIKVAIQRYREKKEPSPLRKEYDSLRRMAAEALAMNACYYCNPVDVAQYGNRLPEAYEKGSEALRELGAKFRGFAETLPDEVRDLPLSKAQITEIGSNFIGLSNSFNTPYRCPEDRYSVQSAREMEKTIRSLLRITKT